MATTITRRTEQAVATVEADDCGNVALTIHPTGFISVGSSSVTLTPDEAEQLATALHTTAAEAAAYRDEMAAA